MFFPKPVFMVTATPTAVILGDVARSRNSRQSPGPGGEKAVEEGRVCRHLKQKTATATHKGAVADEGILAQLRWMTLVRCLRQ